MAPMLGRQPRRRATRRKLGLALVSTLALAGLADAFVGLARGGGGPRAPGRCREGTGSELAAHGGRNGEADISTWSPPVDSSASSSLGNALATQVCAAMVGAFCLAGWLFQPLPSAADEAADAPPPAKEAPAPVVEGEVQIVGEDGAVVGAEGYVQAPKPKQKAKPVLKLPGDEEEDDGTGAKKARLPYPTTTWEERLARRNAKSEDVTQETWYKRGKIVYVAKCAGCHPAGGNSIKRSKSLFWDDLEREGYRDFDKFKTIIRYGKGKMPGYAEDCAEVSDYTQCGVISSLDEQTLQDVEDFTLNRANNGWTGRG